MSRSTNHDIQAKGALVNVREFKQTFEQILQKQLQQVVSEQQELTKVAEDLMHGIANTTPSPNKFSNPSVFLLKPDNLRTLDTADLMLPTAYDIIEDSLKKQNEKTKHLDEKFTGNPSEIIQTTGINFDEIPTISQIEQQLKTDLLSLTEQGKLENGLMLPRKEMNYVTPSMMQTGRLKNVHRPIPPYEVVLKIALYHPEKNLKTQEYAVLGSQKLTELKDALYCLSDHIIGGKNTPSSYLFIENIFYNDMRDSRCVDYSKDIISWVTENERWKQPGLAKYTSRKMEDTTFYDLSIRVGERYLYCHQGNCKHYIIFTDLRLTNDEDHPNANAYPLRVFQAKVRRRKCCVCEIYPAKYVTYRDKNSSEEPSFYCDSCYRQFHYNADGKLLYDDFEVYRYFHE